MILKWRPEGVFSHENERPARMKLLAWCFKRLMYPRVSSSSAWLYELWFPISISSPRSLFNWNEAFPSSNTHKTSKTLPQQVAQLPSWFPIPVILQEFRISTTPRLLLSCSQLAMWKTAAPKTTERTLPTTKVTVLQSYNAPRTTN